MITEDFVSFETAKLLKEKGFDADNVSEFGGYYVDFEHNGRNVGIATESMMLNKTLEDWECLRPTLQMAMKWLREVHNISIEPLVDFGSGDEYWWTADVGYIKKDGLIDELCGYNSYEEACEAAIKYCLENLI